MLVEYELIPMLMEYFVAKGLLQTQTNGKIKMMDVLDEQRMYRLYEKFILEYYRCEFPQLKASPSQIAWQLDDDVRDTLHSGNMYQIFTYVKNKETELAAKPHEVAGMLLYAKTDEAIDFSLPVDSYHGQLRS